MLLNAEYSNENGGGYEVNAASSSNGEKLSVYREPRSFNEIMALGTTGLIDEFTALAEMVRDSTKEWSESVKYGELEDASPVVERMTDELKKLQQPTWLERIPVIGKRASKQMLIRKSILEVLDGMMEQYRSTAENLKNGVVKMEMVGQSAVHGMQVLDAAIERLSREKEILEAELDKEGGQDPYVTAKIRNRVNQFEATINQLLSLKGQQHGTIIGCQINEQTRSNLYATMTFLAPHIETIARQQTAMVVSNNEVATAVRINTAAIEGMRAATIQNAKMQRENAESTAKAAYMPIIDATTHKAVETEVIAMLGNVRTLINQSLEQGKLAANTADECTKNMQTKLLELSNEVDEQQKVLAAPVKTRK